MRDRIKELESKLDDARALAVAAETPARGAVLAAAWGVGFFSSEFKAGEAYRRVLAEMGVQMGVSNDD